MRARWKSLFLRALIASAIAWILGTVPLPEVAPGTLVAYVQVPIAIFLLICYLGKLLIDTFFYNRYQP
ncbi:MAG: hypothetical protein M1132_01310 [Chloroflexi bacterium]|nr:hypothetical protein [Chloroflexota bacterium]